MWFHEAAAQEERRAGILESLKILKRFLQDLAVTVSEVIDIRCFINSVLFPIRKAAHAVLEQGSPSVFVALEWRL